MNINIRSILLAGMAAIILSSCTAEAEKAEPVDMEKAKAEIQSMEDAYAAGEAAKDAAAVAAYYSDDAISYMRNREPVKGKEAIQAAIAQRMSTDTTGEKSVYKVVDIFAEGDMLVEVGSYNNTNAAGVETDKGHYMSFFKKQANGKYACVRDMSVTSMPAK